MNPQMVLWSDRAASRHAGEVSVLASLAVELARKAGPSGITVDNILTTAATRGLMSLMGKGRQHSFLGAVCRHAGLQPTGHRVRSQIAGKNGNWRQTWVLP